MMKFRVLWRGFAIAALAVVTLISAPRKPYSTHEKAYYASPDLVEFVRPGLTITVNSAAIAANGAITVTYTLTDPNGLPLDSGESRRPDSSH